MKLFRFFRKIRHGDIFKTCALVVDDDKEVAFILSRFLIWMDVVVHTVTGENAGEKALVLLKKQHFDIVFLDLEMPNIGGVELIRYIKREYHKTIIIIVSGFIDKYLTELQSGYIGILTKPFNQMQIRSVLEFHRLPHR